MRPAQAGFTYVFMMAALATFSIGLAVIGPRWADQAKREREQELVRVGSLYASAIASYYAAAPGSLRHYPPELKDLLEDTRRVGTLRHIRKLYADPLDPFEEPPHPAAMTPTAPTAPSRNTRPRLMRSSNKRSSIDVTYILLSWIRPF